MSNVSATRFVSSDSHFKAFVERQQRAVSVENATDWNKERDNWLGRLRLLYDTITEYLDEYIKSGMIKLRDSTIELNEENIGVYSARRLIIVIGVQEVSFTPVGTLLIGSKGRVDVEGSGGNSRLVLIDKTTTDPRQMVRVTVTAGPTGDTAIQPTETSPTEIEWVWKIVSRAPFMQFIELNKQTLFEMLMEVSNG